MLHRLTYCSAAFLLLAGRLSSAEGADSSRLVFKDSSPRAYRLVETAPRLLSAPPEKWLKVVSDDRAQTPFQLGSRIILQLEAGADVDQVLRNSPAKLVKTYAPGLHLLQATDAWQAIAESKLLGDLAGVQVCRPEMKRPLKLHGAYASQPTDPYFDLQWHLENRASNGARLGVDVNARAAWPNAMGAGVSVAVVDAGVDMTHPDLLDAISGMPHYDFYWRNTNAGPYDSVTPHGTAVAGLIAARGNNGIGVSGVAPAATVASWAIFEFNDIAGEADLADMFQAHSNSVAIQNHSWGKADFTLLNVSQIEAAAITNAIQNGRDGKGVVMVRSAGNDRSAKSDANEDGYANDPRVVTVAAVRQDGQVTSYSTPGTCILLAAPSGDTSTGFGNVLTTDQKGNNGLNLSPPTGADAKDYTYFSGTSASAPIVSGIAALILETNPDLTYRDVQQVLINAARQTDPTDPLIRTNQAGYRVSVNTGFGVPDAGRAVRLAGNWPLRPSLTTLSFPIARTNQIPNQGLRVETFGNEVPLQLASIVAAPGVGMHPEDLTPFMPIEDVGWATAPITQDLTGKAALIRRGTNSFLDKINYAAAAGAKLAIIANYPGTNKYEVMGGTFRALIPSVFISGDDGVALRDYIGTNGPVQVRSILSSATYTNHVSTPLLIEHVGVRIKTDHSQRGDLRVTVTSPAGTRSQLQRLNNDFTGGPVDWTYWTTHHFYESSQGIWTIQVSDEINLEFGNCLYAELILRGVAILDQDRDGLDDTWELTHFQNLASGPAEDADDDGESNMAEYVQGTDPLSAPAPFAATISQWSPDYFRLSWPANLNRSYQILGSTDVTSPFMTITNLPGSFDTGEWFTPATNFWHQFFMIRSSLP